MPELTTYFQAGGLVDSVINQGLPAPIDIQVSGNDMDQSFAIASQIAARVKNLKDVSDVLIPQNLRLSRSCPEHRPGTSQPDRVIAQGDRRQRHYRADFQRHDCAQLLDRPQDGE